MHADFLKRVNTWKFTRKAQKVLAFLPPVGELQIVYRLSIFFFFKLQGLNCLEPRHILDKRVCVGEPGGGGSSQDTEMSSDCGAQNLPILFR